MNHVSVTANASTGGRVGSLINASLIKGSFHRLLLPAAGEILLPFTRRIRETVAGNWQIEAGSLGIATGSDCLAAVEIVGTASGKAAGAAELLVGIGDRSPIVAVLQALLFSFLQSDLEFPVSCSPYI